MLLLSLLLAHSISFANVSVTDKDIVDKVPDGSELVFDKDFTVLAHSSPHWDKTPLGTLANGSPCSFYVAGDRISNYDRLIKAGRKFKTVEAFEGALSGVYLHMQKTGYVAVFCAKTQLTIGEFRAVLAQAGIRLEIPVNTPPPAVEFDDLSQ